MTDGHANPAVPSTVGALLAEETTIDPGSSLPSFIELMMMEEMTESARKVVKTFVDTTVGAIIASRESRVQGAVTWYQRGRICAAQLIAYLTSHYSPEIRMILIYAVQRRFLQSKACGTVVESAYGTQRSRLGPLDKDTGERTILPMKEVDKIRLALLLAVGPYVKERLETLFEGLNARRSMRPFSATTSGKLKSLFVAIYPFLQMTHEGSIVAYHWLYLIGKSWFFHPSSHLLQQVVRRVTVADSVGASSQQSEMTRGFDGLRKLVFLGASSALVVGWIAQWHTLVRQHQRLQHPACESSMPPPPTQPIVHLDPKQRLRPLPSNRSLCSLCRQPRVNPAASTSGYVFCHRCIVMYVRDHGTCPLTGMECPESRITRLYEPVVVQR